MPTIRFQKNFPPLVVAEGENLREALMKHGVPVASSCAGDGVCGKCGVIIVDGASNLSPAGELEKKLLQAEGAPAARRISCLVNVGGDLVVDNPYW